MSSVIFILLIILMIVIATGDNNKRKRKIENNIAHVGGSLPVVPFEQMRKTKAQQQNELLDAFIRMVQNLPKTEPEKPTAEDAVPQYVKIPTDDNKEGYYGRQFLKYTSPLDVKLFDPNIIKDAKAALVKLGYKPAQANLAMDNVVNNIDNFENITTENLITMAIKEMK